MWIDFTRRNDPACSQGGEILSKYVASAVKYPDVLCLWSKNPAGVVQHCGDSIKKLQDSGTLILAQITANFNYSNLEPNVPPVDLSSLLSLIGNPLAIRLRFDPIIIGVTKISQFQRCILLAQTSGIERIITNFLVPSYKGVGRLLIQQGFPVELADNHQRKRAILSKMIEMLPTDISLAVCAETAEFASELPLQRAACSDVNWAISLRPELNQSFSLRPSRKNCGCCYSADIGVYRSQKDGYPCPHQCVYCYAK